MAAFSDVTALSYQAVTLNALRKSSEIIGNVESSHLITINAPMLLDAKNSERAIKPH